MGGLPEVWPGCIPDPEALLVSWGSTSIPRVGLGAATANPEGLWVWPHHGRGLSHRVQIKTGSQTYLACTAVWSGESQDLSMGFCFSFAKGASRPLPNTAHSPFPVRAEEGASSSQEVGGAVSDLESVLTHYLQK